MYSFLLPTEMVCGQGAVSQLSKYVAEKQKVMIITDKSLVQLGIVEKITKIIEDLGAEAYVYDDIPQNPHAPDVYDCLAKVKEGSADVLVALGGGSPMDVAKVVAMMATDGGELEDYQWNFRQATVAPLPYIAIPTTAGTGSEATKTAVIVDRDTKKGFGGNALFAKAALIDPEMTVTLPPSLTATTGADALTHAVEAYVSRGSNPWTDSLALEAISMLSKYLPRAYANGQDLIAREKVAVASAMAGLAMDQSGLGVVHSISGPIASHYDVPHGLSNAVLLVDGMKYNLMAVPERYARIAQAMGVNTEFLSEREAAEAAVDAVEQLFQDMQMPTSLNDYYVKYGADEGDVPRFAEEACAMFLMRSNPRTPAPKEMEVIIRKVLGC